MSGVATPSAPIAGSAYVIATMMSTCAVMLPCFAFGYSLQKLYAYMTEDKDVCCRSIAIGILATCMDLTYRLQIGL